jgi:cardiolipin synthase
MPLALKGYDRRSSPVNHVIEIWALVGILFVAWFVLVSFFAPRIDYRISAPPRLDSEEFLRVIQATCQAAIIPGNRVEVLTNGSQFYPSMLDAIRAAEASVNVEAYIFEPGELAERFIDVLIDRARAGVEIRVLLDSIGSSGMGGAPVGRLRSAGCHVHFYQSISLYRLHRLNNRTHRELLIVDGAVAFNGGAGVADRWAKPIGRALRWRDTMTRLEGPIVTALQGVFAENWLEASGEILIGPRHWPRIHAADSTEAMLVKSSPSDRATASRVVFQMLIEGAARENRHQHPLFSSGSVPPPGVGPCGAEGCLRARSGARAIRRSTTGTTGEPADVPRTTRGRNQAVRIPTDDDARQDVGG